MGTATHGKTPPQPPDVTSSPERQKLKLLHLARIFHEQTDDAHGLTMPQIIEQLAACGIPAERKAVYRDIAALRAFGFDIDTLPRRPVEYALITRTFSLAELQLLIDAVQSSRFLTRKLADDLVKTIRKLGSRQQAKKLFRHVHVDGRIKTKNESVYRNVDTIQEAIELKRKLSFRYFEYDLALRERVRHGGEPYERTPVALIFSDGCYYLVAYSVEHDEPRGTGGLANFRVDRMRSLMILDEPAEKSSSIARFDPASYQRSLFGMYLSEDAGTPVTLRVNERAMNGIVDRFGRTVKVTPAENEHEALVNVNVMTSPPFFGWVAQFGGDVVVEGPASAVEAFRAFLGTVAAAHDKHPEKGAR